MSDCLSSRTCRTGEGSSTFEDRHQQWRKDQGRTVCCIAQYVFSETEEGRTNIFVNTLEAAVCAIAYFPASFDFPRISLLTTPSSFAGG